MCPRLRNREGEVVDPWPFVAVAGTGVLPVLSFGPLYLNAFGVPLSTAVGLSLGVAVAVVGVAYHQLVLTHRPEMAGEVPAADRLKRLFYAMLVLLALLLLLTLPLLGRSL